MKSLELRYCQVPDYSEGVRNLCVNIYRHHDYLSDCEPDKDQSVFTRSDFYLGVEHVLEHAAHILRSYSPVCCWECELRSSKIL